jgi:adenosylmethionine-8-amino-7-oxononanoate aminotransferase
MVPTGRALKALGMGISSPARTNDPTGATTASALWHPFSQMAEVAAAEFVVSRADDVWFWDADGRRYLDGSAGLWHTNVGHGRTEILDAIAAQLRVLPTYPIFQDLAHEPALALSARLSDLAPMDGAKVFFGSGGSDGVDTAAKLCRLYWHTVGCPERSHIISRDHAYHGSHAYGTSLGGVQANRDGYGDMVPTTSQVAYDSVDALAAEVDRIGADRVAAFILEPVIGSGGLYPPPDGYIEGVGALCRERGIFLIVDSTICGFGRVGTWFGIERWDVQPDMVVFAKGVTSGYLPLGGVVVSGHIAEPFWAQDGPSVRHGMTYAAHATCCAAALANLDILERENLVVRGRDLEGDLYDALATSRDHPAVGEVRGGIGLMAGVCLAPDLIAARPTAPGELYRAMRDNGVHTRGIPTGVALAPPLTVGPEHLEIIADAVRKSLDDVAGKTV